MTDNSDNEKQPMDVTRIDEQVEAAVEQELQGHDLDSIMNSPDASSAASAPAQAEPSDSTSEAAAPTDSAASIPAVEAKHHEFRRGRIAAVRGEDIFVDLQGEAGKLQGVVPLTQFERPPRIGSIMDFVVDSIDETQGLVFLSREGAISRATWDTLNPGATVEARCVATNKGGLELEMIGGIRAFMPASQIDIHHVGELEPMVGQKLEAVVQDIDRKSKKVVLSRRQFLEQRKASAREALFEKLTEGDTIEGKVANVVDYGAFIDLGGVDGLLHVSDMSYSHVNKPEEVVSKGQELTLKVLKIDRDKGRVSLGLKQVQPDPWELLDKTIAVGAQVTGTIVRTAQFGAFVQVSDGVEGLLPISEMSWKRIHNAEEVVAVGQSVRLSVLGFEPAKRRLTLSLKQATGDPWVGAENKYAQDSMVEGKVIGTTDFGAFVELEPGIEGLVHISELAPKRVDAVTDIVKPGDVKEFRVLDIDETDRKIRLSLKPASARPHDIDPSEAEALAQRANKPGSAKRRKRRDSLKGGMGDVNSIGLGNLSMDDLQ